MLKYNPNKDGQTQIYDLLNASLKKATSKVSSADVSLADPTSPSENGVGYNTEVKVSVVPGSKIIKNDSPPIFLRYTRINFAKVIRDNGGVLNFTDNHAKYIDDSSLMNKFLSICGVKITAAELTMTRKDSDQLIEAEFKVADKHYGLTGSAIMVISNETSGLDDAFPGEYLRGFNDPEHTLSK
ncbi:hypothetical protein TOTORO_01520 [Serratia phage vB_SmaS-Totoro]|nr:hypothetical protein TOTORO_01520 [Serratia phage vB_SmaS-Totoro]